MSAQPRKAPKKEAWHWQCDPAVEALIEEAKVARAARTEMDLAIGAAVLHVKKRFSGHLSELVAALESARSKIAKERDEQETAAKKARRKT